MIVSSEIFHSTSHLFGSLPTSRVHSHVSSLSNSTHLIALVLPNEDELGNDETLEPWYVDQVFAMTKAKAEHMILQKTIPEEAPTEVATKMSAYLRKRGSNDAKLRIQITGKPISDHQLPLSNREQILYTGRRQLRG